MPGSSFIYFLKIYGGETLWYLVYSIDDIDLFGRQYNTASEKRQNTAGLCAGKVKCK